MTDIVDRLRSLNADFLHEEAAAEIERLRHDLTLARLDRDHARAERDAARAAAMRADVLCDQQHDEIERLRAALHRIANGDFCAQHMSNPPICVRAYDARLVLGERHHD